MIGGVLERIWAGFTSSYDVDEAIRGSGPRSTALAVSALCTALLLVAHLPACDSAHFDSPWVAVSFALLGGMATVFAWNHGCTGRWGSLATRLDNAFYVLALAWAAGNSSQTYGLFFTACLAAMLLGFQALTYGFGLPMVAAFAVPLAVVYDPVSDTWIPEFTEEDFDMNRAAFSNAGHSAGLNYNIFCAGNVQLADGRLAFMGGHDKDGNHGIRKINIFDPVTETWVHREPLPVKVEYLAHPDGDHGEHPHPDANDEVNTDPPLASDMKYQRWYPSAVPCRTAGS